MPAFKRIGITVKSDLDQRDEVLRKVLSILEKEDVTLLFDALRSACMPKSVKMKTFKSVKEIDLLLVIGGDGTILRAVRELECFSVPILSVNRGTVGFMAEMSIDEAPALLPKLLKGQGEFDDRSVLSVTARRDDKVLAKGCVLNEAVIAQGSIARLIDLKTTVNGEDLTTFRADGLILSTPTGSTAYTLAAGGPIVHPQIEATILTPINSHSFSQKPIVLPGDHEIEVEVLSKPANKFGDVQVSLTLDGQTYIALRRGDTISAHINAHKVRFLRRKRETFYTTLRAKLKWGERPQD